MSRKVYADNAATTPMSSASIKAMMECMRDSYGNPSGVHSLSQKARAIMDDARKRISACIGANPNEIFFTSNGSESDNWAIKGVAELKKDEGRHIITTSIEHHAIINSCEHLKSQGYDITYLPTDDTGLVSIESLENEIREDTILISVMMANNEVGTIQPIRELSRVARDRKILFHTDAVQTVGHIPVIVDDLGVDLLTMAGHKFGGPKGVGALYIRRGIRLPPLIHGGGQEKGMRAGPENVAAVTGMAAALEASIAEMEEEAERLTGLRDRLISGILKIPDSCLTGHPTSRLPGIASFAFQGIEGESAVLMLDYRGIQASTGSACSTGSLAASHVLDAIGVPPSLSHGSVRFSLGAVNTEEDIEAILEHMPIVVERLRSLPPLCNCGTKKK